MCVYMLTLASFVTSVNILKLINVCHPTSLAFKLFWVTSYSIIFHLSVLLIIIVIIIASL